MKVHVNTDRGLCKEHILIIFSMTPHEGVELRLLNTGSRVQSNHSPLLIETRSSLEQVLSHTGMWDHYWGQKEKKL